jgi:hypothetical protein
VNTPAPVAQSNFVTVLAWVMLAFGAFSVLMVLLQGLLVNMILPAIEAAMPLALFRVATLLSLAFSAFMTYGAYALLKRRNWARVLYLVMFIVSAVLHVVVAAVFGLGFSLVDLPPAGSEFLPPEVQSVFRAMAIVLAVLMLAMGLGYAWLAHRLHTPAIAAEFRGPSRPAV